MQDAERSKFDTNFDLSSHLFCFLWGGSKEILSSYSLNMNLIQGAELQGIRASV